MSMVTLPGYICTGGKVETCPESWPHEIGDKVKIDQSQGCKFTADIPGRRGCFMMALDYRLPVSVLLASLCRRHGPELSSCELSGSSDGQLCRREKILI